MSFATHLEPRSEFWWRATAFSFLVGALVDLLFGVLVLVFPESAAAWLGVTLPLPRVYLELNGLFLIGLSVLYFMVFLWPRRLAPVAAWGALLRIAGMALFVTSVLQQHADPFFWQAATIDGMLGFLHLICVRLAAGGLVTALRGREG